jgi:hypothetical protein
MNDEEEPHDPVRRHAQGARRPSAAHRLPDAGLVAPEPGGFSLQPRPAGRREGERAQDREPSGPTSIASLDDYGARRAQPSSHRFAPLRAAAPDAARSLAEPDFSVEDHVALWRDTEARYRLMLEQIAARPADADLEPPCQTGHGVAAHGLILALAGRVCLADPTPENRQTIVDLWRDPATDRVAAIPWLPPAQLPPVVLAALDHYRTTGRAADFLVYLPALEENLYRRAMPDRTGPPLEAANPAGAANENEPQAPRAALFASGPAEARTAEPSLEKAEPPAHRTPAVAQDHAPVAEAEFDWRAAAMRVAEELTRDGAQPDRAPGRDDEAPQDNPAEALREQTDARRERQATDFRRAAREVTTQLSRPSDRERERDDDRGLEL